MLLFQYDTLHASTSRVAELVASRAHELASATDATSERLEFVQLNGALFALF